VLPLRDNRPRFPFMQSKLFQAFSLQIARYLNLIFKLTIVKITA
jgi:hypothetical protein